MEEIINYVHIGETSTNLGKDDYLCGHCSGDAGVPVIPKLTKIKRNACLLDLLEFMFSRSGLGIKLMQGNVEDIDLSPSPKLKLFEISGSDLDEFRDNFNLNEAKINGLLDDLKCKGYIIKGKGKYKFTKSGVNIGRLLDLGEYRCLNLYFSLYDN